MSPAPRERLGKLRAGAAALATVNVVVGLGVLVAGVAPGGGRALAVAEATPGTAAPSAPATVLVRSEHPLLATTTTTTTTTSTTATTAPPPHRRVAAGATRRVVSTGYCLEGTTASGVPAGPGMVAMNGVALGSRWRVHDGPHQGATLEVTDRIGHSTEFDIWFDDCADAVAYGRRTISVERVHG